MNIYNKSSLIEYFQTHTDCKKSLEKWYHDVLSKNWLKPSDLNRDFIKARTIKNNRAIFEINGNDYRLIVQLNYSKGWVFVKFIGTHSEYDKIDSETIDLYSKK
jgi:mRNA interferase HigB